jgi:hypothetical protein
MERRFLKANVLIFSLSLFVVLSSLFLISRTHELLEASTIYSNSSNIENIVLPLDKTYQEDHHLQTKVNISTKSNEYIVDINFNVGKIKEIQEYTNVFGYDVLKKLGNSPIKNKVIINYYYKSEPYLSNTLVYNVEESKFNDNILETYHPIKNPDMVWTTLPFKEFCDKYYSLEDQNEVWNKIINGMYISWVGVVVDKTEDSIVISCVPDEWNGENLKSALDKNLSALSYTLVCEAKNEDIKLGEDVYIKGQIVSPGQKGTKNMYWKVYPVVLTDSLR